MFVGSHYILGCIFVIIIGTEAQDEFCPVFGSSQSDPLVRSERSYIFINFEAPSQCRGNITSWRFCHYKPLDILSNFKATLLIYRRDSQTTETYYPVPESVRDITRSYRFLGSLFECTSESLSSEEQFEIQENDVVGACLWSDRDDEDISLLHLVGSSIFVSDLTYQVDADEVEGGGCNSVRSTGVTREVLLQRSKYRLHLSTDISIQEQCRAGNNPPSAALSTGGSGTYLNTQYPVTSCGNHITKWHYCYYTEAATPGSTLSMTVAVWSLDVDTNTFIVSPSSIRNITIQPDQTYAKIFCVEESLSMPKYIRVSPGDIIGVVLPSRNSIPILSANRAASNSIRKFEMNRVPLNISRDVLTSLSRTALHLYVSLEYIDLPTSKTTKLAKATEPTSFPITSSLMPTTLMEMERTSSPQQPSNSIYPVTYTSEHLTHTSEQQLTTTPNANMNHTSTNQGINGGNFSTSKTSGNSNLDGGAIAAISLSFVAIFIAIILTILIIVLVLQIKRRKRFFRVVRYKPGFNNIMYGITEFHTSESEERDDHFPCIGASENLRNETYEEVDINYARFTEDVHPNPDNAAELSYSDPIDAIRQYEMNLDEVRNGRDLGMQERHFEEPGSNEEEIYEALKRLNFIKIPGKDIIVQEVIGSGQFGTVNKGEWQFNQKSKCDVALKSLKDDRSKKENIKFLQEAAIMAQFKHPNIISFYGLTEKNQKNMIVVEFLAKGDLHRHLLSLKPNSKELVNPKVPQALLKYCQQVCLGMNYLSKKGFIHRDLASRNILITVMDMCKIADFGLSRDLQNESHYKSTGGRIPIKWTAPEAIEYKKYSTASDVWSYGCVLYEIWSLGHKPFENKGNIEVLRLIKGGHRLTSPPGCPRRMYELMMQCWALDPKERPEFRDVLLAMLESEETVLHIPPDAATSHPEASLLGAPLSTGYNMYPNIHLKYFHK